MAITKIGTDIIANDAITADKIAAGALDTQLAGYLSTNSFATESYVGTAISNLVDSSPATLDTLNELAAALGDDPNFATTTATAIGLKAPIASPSFTGAATFSGNVTADTGEITRLGLGDSAHASAALLINTTNQHIRLNNGSELGVIEVDSGGDLNIWAHGDGETINLKTGSGSGTNVLSVVGNNVGIGTISPSAGIPLTAYYSSTSQMHLGGAANIVSNNTYFNGTAWVNRNSAVGGAVLQINTDGSFAFRRAGTGASPTLNYSALIDASGNVGIGTSSPSTYAKFAIRGGITVNAGSTSLTGASFSASDAVNSTFWITHAGGTTNLITDVPMAFYTASGSGVAERMRLDASGSLYVGLGYTTWQSNSFGVEGLTTGAYTVTSHINGSPNGQPYSYFFYNNAVVGNINQNGTTGVTYTTTSDFRLKKDIKPINNPTQKLLSMNPVTHGWINDPDANPVIGFIAQEMMNIVPEAISGTPEGEEMMGMDYGRITPIIVAALQEALKEIEELKTRISEMENK